MSTAARVRIDGAQIRDWDSFHTVFVKAFDFPDYYGRNLDAWIDCMSDLNDLTVLCLDNVDAIPREIYDAITDCTAFVNMRCVEAGETPCLLLAFHRSLH